MSKDSIMPIKVATFRNIDHSSRAIVGELATTYHQTGGSNEGIEKSLELIYKEICAKDNHVTVNVPEKDAPIVNISLPELPIVNNYSVNQEAQAITVTFDIPKILIFINIGLSLLAIAVAMYTMVKNG